MKKRISKAFGILLFILVLGIPVFGQETEIVYLSGTGKDHTVDWEFFCTEGRKSGQWTTIPVPSNWELQGFGKYNYGHDKDADRGKEKGLYKYRFNAPADWRNKVVKIVFEGSMTDTEVKINGKSAGAVHQGAFYRFQYDISKLLKTGSNLLEVTVSKHSANESVNKAERFADYWIFGGIYRPVYLEILPKQHIDLIKIDAGADGKFTAETRLKGSGKANGISAQILTLDGGKIGSAFRTDIKKGSTLALLETEIASPKPWTPEFPNLYEVEVSLLENGNAIHTVKERFGFRTVELRERDGIYVNGTKIKFRGVNRHSFWPASGRTTSRELSVMDVQLMKDMNMNAVRMSHYPPDKHFLEVCDSLGLFVIDELTGWHDAYDTLVGSKLVKEMVERDVNHPSIVIWANGNEGGHNEAFDPLFKEYDIQKRPVIQPWRFSGSVDDQHYINYNYGNGAFFQGREIFFPTEFLHGLYDGGLGAGLKDFWELMWNNPLSAGGFLWVFADEGVVRTDKNGEIDTDGDHGADGILGPYREKEASFYAIKEVWSPVFIERREITPAFDGSFRLENRFFYTNLSQCKFDWKLAKVPGPEDNNEAEEKTGSTSAPDIQPGRKGDLNIDLPSGWQNYDILYLSAYDPSGREIYTWSWAISRPEKIVNRMVHAEGTRPVVSEKDSTLTVAASGVALTFNRNNGMLVRAENDRGVIPFGDGPVLAKGEADFQKMSHRYSGDTLIIESDFAKNSEMTEMKWSVLPSGWLKLDVKYVMVRTEEDPYGERHEMLGVSFSYPEQMVKGVRYLGAGPYRVWKNRTEGNTLGIWSKEYNNSVTGAPPFEYPEFKGYHGNFYWAKVITSEQPFTVATEDEDIFLHLFTPEFSENPYHTAPAFPEGNFSFMHGITPIGTKSQHPLRLGPGGQPNMYFDYWKQRPKEITLYFDFRGR